MKMLKDAGMEKINFSGGEPFIKDKGKYLGKLVKYGKEELQLSSVTIVSNGSLIRESWFKEFGKYLDIIAISCDSFNEETNKKIGRGQGSRSEHVKNLIRIQEWCNKYNVLFKINTVVNMYNIDENMAENISILKPIRWKVFQCLLLEGENVGKEALRNAEPFYVSDDLFKKFLDRHAHLDCLVPESNDKMKDSYLILDEYMRFLNCQQNSKHPSPSLLDVGVDTALSKSGFDENMFLKRGGVYKWSKPKNLYEW
ncbi:S-adenosylmethionine-dependent nucleotide dehydratase RSAD2-like [Rhodnius prolixus]